MNCILFMIGGEEGRTGESTFVLAEGVRRLVYDFVGVSVTDNVSFWLSRNGTELVLGFFL